MILFAYRNVFASGSTGGTDGPKAADSPAWGSDGGVRSLLTGLCEGVFAEDRADMEVLNGGSCEVVFDVTRGLASYSRVDGSGLFEVVPPNSIERDAITEVDLRLFEELGFDLSEVGDVSTTNVMSQADGDDPACIGTLTVIERQSATDWVPGSRMTAVRDGDGELISLIVVWPTIGETSLIDNLAVELAPAEIASIVGVSESDVLWSRTAPVPLEVHEGTVTVAERVDAAVWRVDGPEGASKWIGGWFRDGEYYAPPGAIR